MATATAVKPSLTIKRRFNAPPAKVYAAWTDPEKMKGWMGPGEIKTVHAESDPRPGGRYQINMRTPAGEAHDVSGVFREVIANEKLVYTWAWKSTPERESLVTVTFKADGTGTLLTLTHEQFFDEAARDGHRGGWEGALVKLEKYLALESRESCRWPTIKRTRRFLLERADDARRGESEEILRRHHRLELRRHADAGRHLLGGEDGRQAGRRPVSAGRPAIRRRAGSWMSYLAVDDVDARVKKATAAGAKLMRPIFDVPGVGRIAILTEPGGAGIGWITPTPR